MFKTLNISFLVDYFIELFQIKRLKSTLNSYTYKLKPITLATRVYVGFCTVIVMNITKDFLSLRKMSLNCKCKKIYEISLHSRFNLFNFAQVK